jgi:hypothetical protein
MLSEGGQSQKVTYYKIPFIWNIQKPYRDKKIDWWLPRGNFMEKNHLWLPANGYRAPFGEWWKCSVMIVVEVAQLSDSPKKLLNYVLFMSELNGMWFLSQRCIT